MLLNFTTHQDFQIIFGPNAQDARSSQSLRAEGEGG